MPLLILFIIYQTFREVSNNACYCRWPAWKFWIHLAALYSSRCIWCDQIILKWICCSRRPCSLHNLQVQFHRSRSPAAALSLRAAWNSGKHSSSRACRGFFPHQALPSWRSHQRCAHSLSWAEWRWKQCCQHLGISLRRLQRRI